MVIILIALLSHGTRSSRWGGGTGFEDGSNLRPETVLSESVVGIAVGCWFFWCATRTNLKKNFVVELRATAGQSHQQ